jgi:hypothetical protein
VYAGAAALASHGLAPRPLGWHDGITIVLATIALLVLAEAFDGLAALAALTSKVRRSGAHA